MLYGVSVWLLLGILGRYHCQLLYCQKFPISNIGEWNTNGLERIIVVLCYPFLLVMFWEIFPNAANLLVVLVLVKLIFCVDKHPGTLQF